MMKWSGAVGRLRLAVFGCGCGIGESRSEGNVLEREKQRSETWDMLALHRLQNTREGQDALLGNDHIEATANFCLHARAPYSNSWRSFCVCCQ